MQTKHKLPEKVLQFGEGNFLRAFADYCIELANRQGRFGGSAVLVQPIAQGLCDTINAQGGSYTVLLRGIIDGKTVEQTEKIESVSRCINPYTDFPTLLEAAKGESLEIVISNTTEAGIAYRTGDLPTDVPPASYPAKLVLVLYTRWQHFAGDKTKGLLLLPCELIENNGDTLRRIVLRYIQEWQLEPEFIEWVESCCCFANTLVDRIVTGYPKEEEAVLCEKLGYQDALLDTCEPFFFWAIECPKKWHSRFPVQGLGLDVVFAEDITPYRTRKVRILNGAHTVSVPAAFLAGHDIVSRMVGDAVFAAYMQKAIFEEVIPTINLPQEELTGFANAVFERFANPFIRHQLLDISLNSVSKFKVRCLPSLLDYVQANGALPPVLCFGLSALLRFYQGKKEGECYVGNSGSRDYPIRDETSVCEAMNFTDGSKTLREVLANTVLWGQDLTQLPGLLERVAENLTAIENKGIREAIAALCV